MLFLIICSFAFWLRSLVVTTIPPGQFIGNDSYFYYDLAKHISEHGMLPHIDTDRWVPQGRDLSQILPLYAYAVAYTYKAIALVFTNVSLYYVTLYMPVVCFTIGLFGLLIFLYRPFGAFFSCTVGLLLATFPGTIERSVAGFSDRDSWCLMLGILAVVTYLTALRTQTSRWRWFFILASGTITFLGGFSWEGFGVFLLVILCVELWRFLTSITEERLGHYMVWVLTFVPTLYFASPVYRRGEWFATHVASLVLVPPLVLLLLRVLRYLLITKTPFAEKLKPHARTIAFSLTFISLCGVFIYVLSQLDTFATTTVPFNQTPLMQSVAELKAPPLEYWGDQYGMVFIIACFAFILIAVHPGEKLIHFLFAIPLALFTLTTFFREPLDILCGVERCNWLFFFSVAGAVLGFLIIAWRCNENRKNEIVFVAFGVWFVCWTALSRDAIRYQFFIGISFAFLTTVFIQTLSNILSQKIRNSQYTTDTFRQHVSHFLLKNCLACVMLVFLFVYPPASAPARELIRTAKHIRQPIPGITPITNAYKWMTTKLPKDTVVAASWSYGGQLNVLANVKTITDPDHYLPHWIHLYFRHVFCAQSEREALEFLKVHKATHLMLTKDDLFENAKMNSIIGSNQTGDREFQRIRLKILRTSAGKSWRLFEPKNTPFAYIEAPPDIDTTSVVAHLKNGDTVKLPCIAYSDALNKISPLFMEQIENPYGGVLCVYTKHHEYLTLETASYIFPLSWNSLAIKLFMLDNHSEAFEPIYPQKKLPFADIKIWKINYPSDIKKNPKYLETEPPEGY